MQADCCFKLSRCRISFIFLKLNEYWLISRKWFAHLITVGIMECFKWISSFQLLEILSFNDVNEIALGMPLRYYYYQIQFDYILVSRKKKFVILQHWRATCELVNCYYFLNVLRRSVVLEVVAVVLVLSGWQSQSLWF